MLELKNIHKSFGQHEVLRGVDLAIEDGDVLALIGPSGCGKTTLLRCINFLERPSCGEIELNGHHLFYRQAGKKEILQIRRRIAMVFQSFNLFRHQTAIENVIEGLITVRKQSRAVAIEAGHYWLSKVGLAEKAAAYPSELSGGQQQRVSIARALALEPDLILFDEPTSALDPELSGEVLSVIRDVARSGQTLIIVTHEISFARNVATKIALMDQGLIIEQGSPTEIFFNPKEERTRQFIDKYNSSLDYTI